jgi:hypothetical protein
MGGGVGSGDLTPTGEREILVGAGSPRPTQGISHPTEMVGGRGSGDLTPTGKRDCGRGGGTPPNGVTSLPEAIAQTRAGQR